MGSGSCAIRCVRSTLKSTGPGGNGPRAEISPQASPKIRASGLWWTGRGASTLMASGVDLPVDRDHARASEPDVVLEADRGPVDLTRLGVAAQLPGELRALGE